MSVKEPENYYNVFEGRAIGATVEYADECLCTALDKRFMWYLLYQQLRIHSNYLYRGTSSMNMPIKALNIFMYDRLVNMYHDFKCEGLRENYGIRMYNFNDLMSIVKSFIDTPLKRSKNNNTTTLISYYKKEFKTLNDIIVNRLPK